MVLIEAPPLTLDPRFCVGAYDFKLSRLVYAPLVSVDTPTVEPKMELAESIEARSPTEYVVTIRANARFSDGRTVTADDVLYTIGSIRDEKTTSRLKLRFVDDGLTTLEALDARRVRFVLAHPHAPFVTDLDVGILARPAPGHERDVPVGAGAFVLDEVEGRRGDRWRFRPNPHYLFGAPRVKALTVKVIRDDNSRLLALVGGSADLTQNTVSPLLLDAVAAKPELRVESARSSVYTYMGLNCDDPITSDPRVRRAIAYAIDRRRIVDAKLGGRAVLATGMLPTFHWAYAGEVDQYPYDPARARALLDEAGHPDPDGDGPRPRFTLIYKTSSNRFRVALAQVLVSQLAEVGIEVELRPLEFATFFADVKAGNFQLFTMQIPEIAEPDLYTNFFHSSRIPTRENPDLGGNRVRYRNSEIDRLIDRGRLQVERGARIADYREVQRVLARDLPVISLWHEDNVAVMGRRVGGFTILPTAQLTSLARTAK
ncbi:MAG: ABC transporter substrate-binding protein [Myxococcales bacterium]|nr:ABC transporter substrate-binding protein [Myxococcales bacterium]